MATQELHNYQVYICGPIAGYSDLNKKAFEEAEEFIKELGLYPVNPHHIEPYSHGLDDCPGGSKFYGHKEEGLHSSVCYMRTDLARLLQCNAVYVLHGWEASVGGRLEIAVAAQCGLDIYFQDHKVLPRGFGAKR